MSPAQRKLFSFKVFCYFPSLRDMGFFLVRYLFSPWPTLGETLPELPHAEYSQGSWGDRRALRWL